MRAQDQLRAADDVAREAGALALSYFRSERLTARAKGARDLVTAADTASEELIIRRLGDLFPGDGVIAEEGGRVTSSTDRVWYVDPLDGTLNYARGLPLWSISVALVEEDRPVLGVVYDPVRDEMFSGYRGSGAWCNGAPLTGSGVGRPQDAFVHITVDFKDGGNLTGLEDLQRIAPHVMRTRNLGSAALALAYVAAGRLDAMLHRFAYPWDYAAGVVLIEGAGGIVTRITGEPYTVREHAVLAAGTQALHECLLDALQAPARPSLE
jgi:myo-inositol-1(or 4)-monophosphatase